MSETGGGAGRSSGAVGGSKPCWVGVLEVVIDGWGYLYGVGRRFKCAGGSVAS